jgi:signal transduction histidine kinase
MLISRLKETEKSRQQLQILRNEIAKDLHDDIGSTLSSISYYSEAIRKQVKDSKPDVIPLLDKMEKASNNTVDAMSDIVWAINAELDKGANLLNRMHSYVAEMTGLRNIRLEFEADSSFEKSKLNMNVKKNIYLVFKEAVNNAVKYSECKNIHVRLATDNDRFVMKITDDGKGFDTINEFAGNGLKNMKLRAKEIRASLEIISEQNKGCSVILSR